MDSEIIQPYIAIGPSKDYGITVKKSTFDTTFLIITIIFIVLLVFIVGLLIYISYKVTTPTPPPPVKINWPQTSKYYRFQPVREEDKKQIQLCENECDLNDNCTGFYIENSVCHFSTDNLTIENSYPKNTYMKSLDNIKIPNKVYLARNKSSLLKNFWLAPNTDTFVSLPINSVSKINFVPTITFLSSPLIGIYSTSPFTTGDALYLYKYNTVSPNFYIHHYGTDLNIPHNFLFKTIYVSYISV